MFIASLVSELHAAFGLVQWAPASSGTQAAGPPDSAQAGQAIRPEDAWEREGLNHSRLSGRLSFESLVGVREAGWAHHAWLGLRAAVQVRQTCACDEHP